MSGGDGGRVPNETRSVEYDVMAERDGVTRRMRHGLDRADAIQNAEWFALINRSAHFYLIRRTTVVTEERLELQEARDA